MKGCGSLREFFILLFLFISLVIIVACANQETTPGSETTNSMPTTTEDNFPGYTSEIKLTVTINGLGMDEEAKLFITTEQESEDVFFSHIVKGTENRKLLTTISVDLKDGNYLLMLEAPDKYFRDPKGYFFLVLEGKIINPQGLPIIFNLGPPSILLEPIISLSAPPRQPPPTNRESPRNISSTIDKHAMMTTANSPSNNHS